VIPKQTTELRKDDDEGNTWLFAGWNTKPDGSGKEYAPGATITVTEDITLYVEWYQQTKYSVSMITYLDNTPTDVSEIAGYEKQFFALRDGDTNYISLTHRSAGVYSAKVVENGTYVIYTKNDNGEYEPVHGHTVVIFGQDGTTECMHYSVNYDTQGGTWAEGEDPNSPKYHYGDAVTAWDKIPTLKGNRFLGWKDQNDTTYAPGQQVTGSITEPLTLTAQWEELITVTVDVVIDHNTSDDGDDQDQDTMRDVTFTLLRVENGVNLPVAEKTLTGGTTSDDNITTYQVVFENMPQGIYNVACTKSNYECKVTPSGAANEPQTINVRLNYTPDNFDLVFDVVVNAENDVENSLMPKAVNVKVSYWGYGGEKGELGWHIITQQEGTHAPTTITIDKESGKGRGFFPVWRY
jgi:hypothetical protein